MGSILTTCCGSGKWSCREDRSAVLSNMDGAEKEDSSFLGGGLSMTCFAASVSGSI